MLARAGAFPIRDHYYEPLFRTDRLTQPLDRPRPLPGIDLDMDGQLEWLARFRYGEELDPFPRDADDSGRLPLPQRHVRVGGCRVLLLAAPHRASPSAHRDRCRVLHPPRPRRVRPTTGPTTTPTDRATSASSRSRTPGWTQSGASIERTPLGTTSTGRSSTRSSANDVLFIDSSHMIRPQGDVLVEFLEILPRLRSGSLRARARHLHAPRLPDPLGRRRRSGSGTSSTCSRRSSPDPSRYHVIGALNHLAHEHPDELGAACPVFAEEVAQREPGSFWMQAV